MVRRNNNTGIRIEDDHLITEREPASPRRGRQTAVELYGVLQGGTQTLDRLAQYLARAA